MKKEEILNDLLLLNNDRRAGYEKAATLTSDQKLTGVFRDMSNQSREIAQELTRVIRSEGLEPEEGTTVKGKIYRTWMDVKNTFTGENPKELLSSCEHGEDEALKAYKTALADTSLPGNLRPVVEHQREVLKDSHDVIKQLRDAQPS